jgi:hypothetical protein
MHPLSLNSLTPATYLVNHTLASGISHSVLLHICEDAHDLSYCIMNPIAATWTDISPIDLPTRLPRITSILQIHDCNAPQYDLMLAEGPDWIDPTEAKPRDSLTPDPELKSLQGSFTPTTDSSDQYLKYPER